MRRRVRSALSVRHSVYVLRVMTQGNTVIAIAAIQRCQSVHARARVSVAPVFMDGVPAKTWQSRFEAWSRASTMARAHSRERFKFEVSTVVPIFARAV